MTYYLSSQDNAAFEVIESHFDEIGESEGDDGDNESEEVQEEQTLSRAAEVLNVKSADSFYGNAKYSGDRSKERKLSTNTVKGKKQAHKTQPSKSKGKRTQSVKGVDPGWRSVDSNFENPNSTKPFVEYVGLKRSAMNAKSPLDYFLLFFTREMFSSLAEQTNMYQQQESAKKPSNVQWVQTTVEELMAFFGIVIAMGIARLPDLEDYWRKDGIFHMPWFSSILSRRRFKQILRYLHVADNSKNLPKSDPNHNKLFKLGNLSEKLNQSFKGMYAPSKELSIDEQMIGTKSRIGFLQYMPKKPKKFGIKVWALCEAVSGYCLQFQIYTGKSADGAEHGLAYRVVFDLILPYLDKGYHLFFDNFYTSLKLLKDLLARATYSCGTIRSDRGAFPVSFRNAKLERGETEYIRNGDIVAVHWKDKRDIFAASSFHGTSKRLLKRHGKEDICKPELICDYNCFMGGVDKCDQFLSYYNLGRKCKKWWKKVFFRMVELCIINAMCLYFISNPDFAKKRGSHKRIRTLLVHEMAQKYLDLREDSEKPHSRASRSSETTTNKRVSAATRLTGKHYAVSKYPKKKKCSSCAYRISESTKKRLGTQTCNYCPKCDAFICKRCFRDFHSKSLL